MQFQPGNLVNARDRVWVVQSDSTDDWLLLRPLGGADDEITRLIPDLETPEVSAAEFKLPDPSQVGSFSSARMFYNALRFQLRSSSGPFRCFGSINFEPRSYQFVPMLMALRQKVVRLLIADDVGVGKTIEAGLIIRELIDRGEIQRFAVLCPPHLVDQWCDELEYHFNLKATALTAGNSQQLERTVPHGYTLTDYYPYLVVSLDYIKTDRHRDYFESMPFDLLLVDEAHTCVRATSSNRQKRFELLQKVTADKNRHLLLLTATPHSGNEDAFFNLLSLLDEKFLDLKENKNPKSKLRQDLANHFIQRRRQDIVNCQFYKTDPLTCFPVRKTTDLNYELDPAWKKLFDRTIEYCKSFVKKQNLDSQDVARSDAALECIALLRCVSSSPAAGIQILNTRLANIQSELNQDNIPASDEPTDLNSDEDTPSQAVTMMKQEFNSDEDLTTDDREPLLYLDDAKAIKQLSKLCKQLSGINKDPKLRIVTALIKDLLAEGFQPVIFCRFVSTAHYVADCLKEILLSQENTSSKSKGKSKTSQQTAQIQEQDTGSQLQIGCITGELSQEARRARVEELMLSPQRILVATDCLSEGINLQHGFTAVIHYDLAWNPTRHEQREGRVDRFGQSAKEVRCAMVYCQDNLIDPCVINIIQEKNRNIKRALGITVPVPQLEESIEQSILASIFGTKDEDKSYQGSLLGEIEAQSNFTPDTSSEVSEEPSPLNPYLAELNLKWEDALKNANKQKTLFAQSTINPEDIAPLYQEQQRLLGSFDDVLEFSQQSCAVFGCKLEPVASVKPKHTAPILNLNWQTYYDNNQDQDESASEQQQQPLQFRFSVDNINNLSLKKSLIDEGFADRKILDFSQIFRASPFVSLLASAVVEQTLSEQNPALRRCALARSSKVDILATIYLLRMRFQMKLSYNNQLRRNIMVEEIVTLRARGNQKPEWDSEDQTQILELLLTADVQGNFPEKVATVRMKRALDLIAQNDDQITDLAKQRADFLQKEHSSIKEYTSDGHVTQVIPCLPADIMGIYVLLPVTD